MPLYLSVPLPGPLRYTRRLGGRHRGGKTTSRVMFWFLIGWWLYPILWLTFGTWWLLKVTVLGCVALVRLARR